LETIAWMAFARKPNTSTMRLTERSSPELAAPTLLWLKNRQSSKLVVAALAEPRFHWLPTTEALSGRSRQIRDPPFEEHVDDIYGSLSTLCCLRPPLKDPNRQPATSSISVYTSTSTSRFHRHSLSQQSSLPSQFQPQNSRPQLVPSSAAGVHAICDQACLGAIFSLVLVRILYHQPASFCSLSQRSSRGLVSLLPCRVPVCLAAGHVPCRRRCPRQRYHPQPPVASVPPASLELAWLSRGVHSRVARHARQRAPGGVTWSRRDFLGIQ
jgi:hypothetical protein